MKLKKIRDNIQERVEKSAWTLSGMKQFEKIRVELVIFAFLIFVCGFGIIESALIGKTLSIYSYSIMACLFFISFLGKSFIFKKMYILNKLSEDLNQNKIEQGKLEITNMTPKIKKRNKKIFFYILFLIFLISVVGMWWFG